MCSPLNGRHLKLGYPKRSERRSQCQVVCPILKEVLYAKDEASREFHRDFPMVGFRRTHVSSHDQSKGLAQPTIHIDITVTLKQANVAFNISHADFVGHMPTGIKSMPLLATRFKETGNRVG